MKLLDLFSGAGGAAVGYHRAGFDEIVGVDNRPMPRYPFTFVQADALEYVREHGHEFDAIHASPPCQAYSRLRHLPWLRGRVYPDLLAVTREALQTIGVPWVIENVTDAPMGGVTICGLTLGIPVSRHRKFESSELLLVPECPGHETIEPGRATLGKRYRHSGGITGVLKEISRESVAGHVAGIGLARTALDLPWMKRDELTQAIPPAYTEFIGRHLIAAIR